MIGGNFRLDPIQATVIRIKLNHLNGWHQQRQKNAQYYNVLFAESELNEKIRTPSEMHPKTMQNHHIFNQYVIRTERRDELQSFLESQGISSGVYYPIPFHLQECFKFMGGNKGDFPFSESAAKEVLALPVYPGITADMQERVVEQIKAFHFS